MNDEKYVIPTTLTSWFQGKKETHPKDRCIEAFDKYKDKILIARDVKKGERYKQYNGIVSGNFDILIREVNTYPYLYEMSNDKNCLAYDLDGKRREDFDFKTNDQILDELKISVSTFIKSKINECKTIEFYSSQSNYQDNPNKVSIHSTVRIKDENGDELYFTKYQDKYFTEEFKTKYPNIKFDCSIYGKNGLLRLLDCSKLTDTFTPLTKFEECKDSEYKLFCRTYLPQNCKNINYIRSSNKKEKTIRPKKEKGDKISPTKNNKLKANIVDEYVEIVDKIPINKDELINLYKSHPYVKKYSIDKDYEMGSISKEKYSVRIVLNPNKHPLQCPICCRRDNQPNRQKHGDENNVGRSKYLIITNTKIRLGCYRYKDLDILLYKTPPRKHVKKECQMDLINRTLDNIVHEYKEDVKWCQPISENKEVEVIRLGLGKGKTTQCIDYILKNGKNKSVLWLSPRQTYASSISQEVNSIISEEKKRNKDIHENLEYLKDINFKNYLDVKQKEEYISFNYLVCQMESLYKAREHYDIVVIDEAESILFQLTSISTQKNKIYENNKRFINLISNPNSKVIFCDAFISNKLFDFLNTLKIKYIFHNYLVKAVPRIAYRCEYNNPKNTRTENEKIGINIFINQLEKKLRNNKRVYLVISSKNFYKKYIDGMIIKLQKENVLNNNDNIFYASGRNDMLQHPDIKREWMNMKLVCCTTSITVGCNFNIENHFDCVFLYISACSGNNIRDLMQSHMRVRHLISNEMYYYLDTNARKYSQEIVDKNEMTKNIEEKDIFIEKNYSELYFKSPECIKELLVNNTLEHNNSCVFSETVLKYYLKECNYELQDIRENEEVRDDVKLKLDFDPMEIKTDYDKIDDITYDQMKEYNKMNMRGQLTESQKEEVLKYKFKCCIDKETPPLVVESLWDCYSNFGQTKFQFCRDNKGLIDGTITQQELDLRDIKNEVDGENENKEEKCIKGIYSNLYHHQLKVTMKIVDVLGLKYLNEGKDTDIPLKTIDDNLEKLGKILEDADKIFSLRKFRGKKDDEKKKLINTIEKILDKVSYYKLCRRGKEHKTKNQCKFYDLKIKTSLAVDVHFQSSFIKPTMGITYLQEHPEENHQIEKILHNNQNKKESILKRSENNIKQNKVQDLIISKSSVNPLLTNECNIVEAQPLIEIVKEDDEDHFY